MSHQAVSLIKNTTARSDQGDETTRRLCAAAYHDREFRDLVVKKVLIAFRYHVSPSYGFDLVPVADHAWRAWSLEAVQHSCVLAVLVITAVCSPATAITALCLLGLMPLARCVAKLAPEVIETKTNAIAGRYLPTCKRKKRHGTNDQKEQARRLKLSLGACCLLLAAPAMTAGAARTPLHLAVAGAAVPLVLITTVTATIAAARYRSITMTQGPGPLRPAHKNRRLTDIDVQQAALLVAYRRPKRKTDAETGRVDPFPADKEPGFFVGSGELVHRWLPPLTIQLLRPRKGDFHDQRGADGITRREHVIPPFQAHELVAHLRTMMRPIGHPADPVRLPGYQIHDRVFVEATDAYAARERLRRSDSVPGFLRKVINNPDDACQHFLEMRVTSSGELVTTVFLRVTVKGRSLTLDLATCALTRTPSKFHTEARRKRSGTKAVMHSALGVLRNLPTETARSCLALAVPARLVRYARARTSCPPTPYAPRFSLREEKAVPWREAVFDEPTILSHMKIIEQRLLRAIEDFLRSRDIDISAFEKRAETIVSASVLNMGGRVDITNSAVGPNPQVNQNSPAPQSSATQGAQK